MIGQLLLQWLIAEPRLTFKNSCMPNVASVELEPHTQAGLPSLEVLTWEVLRIISQAVGIASKHTPYTVLAMSLTPREEWTPETSGISARGELQET